MQIRYYRVGDHPLSICFARDDEADQLLPSFARFRLDTPPSDPLLLRMDVDDRVPWDEPHHEVGHFDSAGNMYGVYLRADGGYQYEINDIQGVLCARVTTDATFGHVAVALVGEMPAQRHFGLNNTLMLAYAFAAADHQTLLMHASVIRQGGRGYLMTAPSGTGKSTHTRLWYDNIPGCDLMNDDNPVVRIWPDGRVIVYGSPWSGKTPCYRNIQAPVGAIVRIRQAPFNKIERLGAIQAYATLMSSASSFRPFQKLAEGWHRTLEGLAGTVPCYILDCLPDDDAAALCHKTVANG